MKGIGFIVALLFLLITGTWGIYYLHKQDLVIEVHRAETHCKSSGEGTNCKYLVYTDKGVFENTDDLFMAKWNSSDFHSKLLKGGKFKVSVVGYRLPFLSLYPNIYECKPLADARKNR